MWGSIDNFIKCLIDYDLTADQAFFIWLIHIGQQDSKNWTYMYKYCNEKNLKNGRSEGGFKEPDIQDLINRGFIEKKSNRGLHHDNLELSSDFSKEFFINSLQAGDELWDTYPSFLEGNKYPAKSFTKFYPNKDELYKDYGKIINYSKEEHDKNISTLVKLRDAGQIQVGLVEWIKGEMWKTKKQEIQKVRYV